MCRKGSHVNETPFGISKEVDLYSEKIFIKTKTYKKGHKMKKERCVGHIEKL